MWLAAISYESLDDELLERFVIERLDTMRINRPLSTVRPDELLERFIIERLDTMRSNRPLSTVRPDELLERFIIERLDTMRNLPLSTFRDSRRLPCDNRRTMSPENV